jgi:acetyl esterase/lipase
VSEDSSVLTRVASPPGARIDYGSHADQHALVWQGTTASAAARPLVLLLHGGFWRPAYDLSHMSPMAAALAAAGWTVANVEYRRVPGAPETTASDLRVALETLPIRIGAHNGRILLAGFSAGGHLALWLAAARAPLHAVLALAPVASLQQARQLQLSDNAVGEFFGATATLQRWDPETLPYGAAPVFIVHGEADDTVPLDLSRRYMARHPLAQLMELAGTGHYALIDPDSRAWPSVLAALRRSAAAT